MNQSKTILFFLYVGITSQCFCVGMFGEGMTFKKTEKSDNVPKNEQVKNLKKESGKVPTNMQIRTENTKQKMQVKHSMTYNSAQDRNLNARKSLDLSDTQNSSAAKKNNFTQDLRQQANKQNNESLTVADVVYHTPGVIAQKLGVSQDGQILTHTMSSMKNTASSVKNSVKSVYKTASLLGDSIKQDVFGKTNNQSNEVSQNSKLAEIDAKTIVTNKEYDSSIKNDLSLEKNQVEGWDFNGDKTAPVDKSGNFISTQEMNMIKQLKDSDGRDFYIHYLTNLSADNIQRQKFVDLLKNDLKEQN